MKALLEQKIGFLSGVLTQHRATEWQGHDETRMVVIRLRPDCNLDIINLKGKPFRVINLTQMTDVQCLLSSNKNRNVILVRIPREYDLVSIVECIVC